MLKNLCRIHCTLIDFVLSVTFAKLSAKHCPRFSIYPSNCKSNSFVSLASFFSKHEILPFWPKSVTCALGRTIQNVLISLLLTASLSLTAEESKEEESNIFDSVLSFFSSGDSQDKGCEEERTSEQIAEMLRSEVCPNFLISQMIQRDEKTMIIDLDQSPDKRCRSINLTDTGSKDTDSHFNTNQDFENYVKSEKPFSEINTPPITDCLSHSVLMGYTKGTVPMEIKQILPEEKHKTLIAEYYQTQQRLESGMRGTLQDITAIDQLIGNTNLNNINCNKFQLTPNILEECESLQKCSSSSSSEDILSQSAKDTMDALKAIEAIDQEIKKLKGPRGRRLRNNRDKIQELKERKVSLQSLYPWVAGKIFQDGYTTGADEKKVAQLIKEQLSYTRTKLHENIHEMQGAFSCIRYNQDCHGLNFDKVMAKTPTPNLSGAFSKDQIERIEQNPSEIDSLSSDQKKALKKDLFTLSQFDTVECLQKAREDVSEVRDELGFLAIDALLAVATVGLGSAAIAGKLAFRAVGHVSKAQRLQNLGLMGVDITFSAPYIDKAIDDCGDYMNELERTASEETNNVCTKLPVRSKLTSDLKSCLLTASLASLPLAVPALAVAGRAGFKAINKVKPPTTPTTPTTPPTQQTIPTERQLPGPESPPALPKPAAKPTTESRAVVSTADDTASSGVSVRETGSTRSTALAQVDETPTSTNVNRNNPAQTNNSAQSAPKLLSAPSNQGRPAIHPNRRRTRQTNSSGSSQREQLGRSAQRNRETTKSRTQAGSSSARRSSQRPNNYFRSLNDPENLAGGRIPLIANIIKRSGILKKRSNSVGDHLHSALTHLRQQNQGMDKDQISSTIAKALKEEGVDIKYEKGIFTVKNNEGIFTIDANGKVSPLNTGTNRSSAFASRQETPTQAARSGAIVLRSNNPPTLPSRRAPTARSINKTNSNTGQQAASTAARTTRSVNRTPQPNSVARNIRAGAVARTLLGSNNTLLGGGAVATGTSTATTAAENPSANNNDDRRTDGDGDGDGEKNENRDRNRNEDRDRDENDDNDEDEKEKNKQNLDCSTYRGGTPQNRREKICYYYMRAGQLAEETRNIQQNTQALNNFKTQVWLGIKENQVPPDFFTNIRKNVQHNQNATADYFRSFNLMYNIARIQDQQLVPNDNNRLRKILQETDIYMNSPNLDGYSHIQESINVLMNRLQIPRNAPLYRL